MQCSLTQCNTKAGLPGASHEVDEQSQDEHELSKVGYPNWDCDAQVWYVRWCRIEG